MDRWRKSRAWTAIGTKSLGCSASEFANGVLHVRFAWSRFTDKAVMRIACACAYAESLFECLRSLPKQAQPCGKAAGDAGYNPATVRS